MKRALNFIAIVTVALFLLAMFSCSTTNKGKYGYRDSRQKSSKVILSKPAVDQFFRRVKPVQKEIDELYGLAVKLQKMRRHTPAIETFKAILQQDPNNIKALNGLAVSLDLTGAHAAAATYYQRALKVNPGLDHVWNNLGYCYFLQNRMDLSISAYQKAIAIDPELQKYRNNLALVSGKRNEISGSPEEIVAAPKMRPLSKASAKPAQKKAVTPVYKKRPQKLDATPLKGVATRKTLPEKGQKRRAFTALPSLKTVKHIAAIRRSKISIRANKSIKAETVLTISDVMGSSPGFQVSLPKSVSDGLASMPPVKWNPIKPVKHLKLNRRLIKKRVGGKKSLKHITIAANQASGIEIIGLEVSNGNGVRHLARRVTTHLNNRGVQVSRVSNARHYQFLRTRLYYRKGFLGQARKLAKIIPGKQEVIEVPAFDDDHIRIRMVLGRDISSAKRLL